VVGELTQIPELLPREVPGTPSGAPVLGHLFPSSGSPPLEFVDACNVFLFYVIMGATQRSPLMTSRRLLPFAVLGLALAAFPTQGQSAPLAWLTEAADRCAPALGPAGGSSLSFRTQEEVGGGPALDSFCSASCDNGAGPVSVSCPGQCQAQDQDCDLGIPGYVQCGAAYPSYCPACPSTWNCTAQKYCPDGYTFISCQGQSTCDDGCYAGEPCDVESVTVTRTWGTCYIECDGVYTYCPGTISAYICNGTEQW